MIEYGHFIGGKRVAGTSGRTADVMQPMAIPMVGGMAVQLVTFLLARSTLRPGLGFWDTAEGRMTPEPVRPPRDRSGLMARYLLADPHVEEPD